MQRSDHLRLDRGEREAIKAQTENLVPGAETYVFGSRTDPAARGGMEATGAEIVGSSPEEMTALQRRETVRWGAVITRLGLTVTD